MMNLCTYLFLFIFGLSPGNSNGQMNISGNWSGTITQNEGGYRSEYNIQLYLQQDGNQITGRSYVRVDNIFAEMELTGTLSQENIFNFQELKIVSAQSGQGMEWCLKKASLKFKKIKDTLHLTGEWEGNTSFSHCIPGKIKLKKNVPRA